MKHNIKTGILLFAVLLSCSYRLSAQPGYSLQQLIDSAKKNSRLITVKEYQVQERISKLKENEIKRYPSAMLDANYQYNFKLPDITIPAGTLGSTSTGTGGEQLLPAVNSKFTVGSKRTYNAGLILYQPITQQAKIKTGLAIDKTDIKIGRKEKEKVALQLHLAVEQFYYGALIVKKQTEAEDAKIELAKSKLYDAEGALAAGKTIAVNIAGIRAEIANNEQSLLKLQIEIKDYLSELSRLTNLDVGELKVPEVRPDRSIINPAIEYTNAATSNPDMEIARLNKEKAILGISAASQGNLPDVGLVTGYYVQQGNPVLPKSSPYAGVSLKWNIQDLFSNKQVLIQRQFQLRQAEETIAYTRTQLDSDIDKALRKIKQSEALIIVAEKVVGYRKDALKEQQDKLAAGFNTKTAILETKSKLAEAEADLYASQLSSALAFAALKNLAGQ